MNYRIERWLGVVAGLAAGLALLWVMYGPRIQEKLTEPEEPPVAAAPTPPPARDGAPAAGAEPLYPVPAAPAPATPKPKTAADPAASDEQVRRDAAAVFGNEPVETFLIPHRVVQNVVATVDSLDRDAVPLRFRAVGSVAGQPMVEPAGDGLVLTAENGDRYRFLVAALEHAAARDIAGFYLRYYPLFQTAYRELGYPQGYFNDRVVQIIDHLLATPEVPPPIELVRPKVLYEFADPALEARSSGQKTLIRMGPENAAIVKAKLREVRTIITAGGPASRDGAPAPG